MRDSNLNKPQTKYQSWEMNIQKTKLLHHRLEEGWSYFQRIFLPQEAPTQRTLCEASGMTGGGGGGTAEKKGHITHSSWGKGKQLKFFQQIHGAHVLHGII